MLPINIKRCFVAEYIVDFRKGHYGLLGEAKQAGLDLYAGDLVVFISRNRRRLKAIFGDDSGLTIIDKVFSSGSIQTAIRFIENRNVKDISLAELSMIFEGSSYTVHKKSKKWLPKNLHD